MQVRTLPYTKDKRFFGTEQRFLDLVTFNPHIIALQGNEVVL